MKQKILMNMSVDEIEKITDETLKDYIVNNKYNNLLNTMAVLHNYSTRNLLMIVAQNEEVSQLYSKGVWEYKGRTINENAVGVKIIKPLFETNIETKLENLTGYTMAIVYDISETSGESVKNFTYNSKIIDEHRNEIINTLLKFTDNFSVVFSNYFENDDESYVDFFEKKIIVKQGLRVNTAIKNIIEQVANIRVMQKTEKSYAITSSMLERIKQIEAQSIAYIVCKRMGIECEDVKLDFGNLTEEGQKKFKHNLDSIRAISYNIISKIDNVMAHSEKQLDECEVGG